ncbi:hypothetical protein Dxin01_00006 [Deinococcus xinjiangensis]|uniref:Uncharacterized protein n=1 Tax=Deinococcus xinjiangensis TaxID=457454 RepID=A0ABP9V6N4_9DEIO
MKAAYLDRYGPNDVVKIGFLPQPQPSPHDLLVRVRAASVNPVDLIIRSGRLRPILPYTLPLILEGSAGLQRNRSSHRKSRD